MQETPKTLSDREWKSASAKEKVHKRNEFLNLFKKHEKLLDEIGQQVEAFREKLENEPPKKNGEIPNRWMKLAHDALYATKRVDELLSQNPVVRRGKLRSEWKNVRRLWKRVGETDLFSSCEQFCHLEWPGGSRVVYGEKFVLAHYFQRQHRWPSKRKIQQLQSGQLSPSAFYDWVVDRAMKDAHGEQPWKYREVRFGAVAAVARSMLARA